MMKLTHEQEQVLGAIARLCGETPGVPVTIAAVHHTFSDMDVSVLVRHLEVLLDRGFIGNARPTREKIGNTYVLTPGGQDHYHRTAGKGA
jgi:hypothetical protein